MVEFEFSSAAYPAKPKATLVQYKQGMYNGENEVEKREAWSNLVTIFEFHDHIIVSHVPPL